MIVVDPATIAIPNFANDEAEATRLLDRIIHYAKLTSEKSPVKLVLDDDIEDRLGMGAATFDSIRDYLSIMGLEYVYDAGDIFRQVMAIQGKSHRFSRVNFPKIKDYELESLQPDLAESLFPVELRERTKETLLATSFAADAGIPSFVTNSSPVSNALVYDIVAERICVSDGVNEKTINNFSGKCISTGSCEALVDLQFANFVWHRARCEEELFLAICLGAASKLKSAGEKTQLQIQFKIGSQFIASLKSNQAFGNGRFSLDVANTCYDLVAGLFSGTVKTFGLQKQEVREEDNAGGYRCHVTKGGVALRLMYWDINGCIEFSNVGPKKEEIISSGDISKSVSFPVEYVTKLISPA